MTYYKLFMINILDENDMTNYKLFMINILDELKMPRFYFKIKINKIKPHEMNQITSGM